MPQYSSQVFGGFVVISFGGVPLYNPEKPMLFRYSCDFPSMLNPQLNIDIHSDTKKFSHMRSGQTLKLHITVNGSDHLTELDNVRLIKMEKHFHITRKNTFLFQFDLSRSSGAIVKLNQSTMSIKAPGDAPIYSVGSTAPIYSVGSTAPIYSVESRAPIYSQ